MKRTQEFYPSDRYVYDFNLCSTKKGFAQVDTQNDAHYFGNWANPEKRIIFSYIEGDCITVECDNDAEFVEELNRIAEFHGPEFCGIDPGFSDDLKQRFVDLGLSNLLH